jgi:hypothetical protein
VRRGRKLTHLLPGLHDSISTIILPDADKRLLLERADGHAALRTVVDLQTPHTRSSQPSINQPHE